MAAADVLDTGVRISHADFGGRALRGWSAGCTPGEPAACSSGYLYEGVITEDESSTCSGHGTHCASTIGGLTYGVSKDVTIITVQVLSCGGSGSQASVLAGIEWAVENALQRGKPAVLSMSLGGNGGGRYDQVIEQAFNQGVLTVVAAGNSNADACSYSPASAPLAITVGATTISDSKSSFSNYGSCVDIHAPGSGITAAWVRSDVDTRTISGTSMACPHVAGVASQIRALRPSMTPAQITEALLCLATSGVLLGLPSNTANKMLYNGFNSADAASCLGPAPPVDGCSIAEAGTFINAPWQSPPRYVLQYAS